MSALCLLCPGVDKRQPDRGFACFNCANRLLRQLSEIEDYTAGLSTEKTAGSGGRRAPGFSSGSPARDDVIVATDYRSRGGASVHLLRDPTVASDSPIRSIIGSLHGISRWIRDERGLTEPDETPTVTGETRFLRVSLDWCAQQAWIDELADDIAELHRQVRGLSGNKPSRVGVCKYMTKHGECGGQVYSYDDHVKCQSCGRQIDRRNWGRAENMG